MLNIDFNAACAYIYIYIVNASRVFCNKHPAVVRSRTYVRYKGVAVATSSMDNAIPSIKHRYLIASLLFGHDASAFLRHSGNLPDWKIQTTAKIAAIFRHFTSVSSMTQLEIHYCFLFKYALANNSNIKCSRDVAGNA